MNQELGYERRQSHEDNHKTKPSNLEKTFATQEPKISKESSRFVYILTSFAAVGGFLFGYDTGVVSGAMIFVQKHFSLTNFWHELIVSSAIAAAIFGAVVGGPLNELLGRRLVLLISSVVFTAGAVVKAGSYSKEMLLLGRIVVGTAIGLCSMTVPIYIAESAPVRYRGKLVTLNCLFVTGGQCVAGIVDGIFSGDQHQGWRYMFGIAAFPSIVMFWGLLYLPESPRWLMKKSRAKEAEEVLKRLRGYSSVDKELKQIEESLVNDTSDQDIKTVLRRICKTASVRNALVVGCGLQAIQQLSGINTVMYYSATIMKMAGVRDNKTAIWLSALIAFGNFVFTIAGVYLVEYLGRRKLVLGSLGGVVFSLLLLTLAFQLAYIHSPRATIIEPGKAGQHCTKYPTCELCVDDRRCGFCYQSDGENVHLGSCLWSNSTRFSLYGRCKQDHNPKEYIWKIDNCPSKFGWLAVFSVVFYIGWFAPGMAPMPWTINSEIYPLWARSLGNAVASATNWICNLVVAMTFLHLTDWLTKAGTFGLYASIAGGGWAFAYMLLPETRGRNLEEIQELFENPRSDKRLDNENDTE